MAKILAPNLKQVHKGQLQVSGTQIAIKGQVANEALRQQVVSNMATSLNPTYSIDNGLVAAGGEAQSLLDKTLSNRVVEFESGSATLTASGRAILDEMAAAIKQIGAPKVQLIGHTDSQGNHQANVALSLARASTVRNYLIDKGIPVESLSASGAGPDQPVASNDTAEGRAKTVVSSFGWPGNSAALAAAQPASLPRLSSRLLPRHRAVPPCAARRCRP
jgi:OOP family OmpA-OmpF porin